MRGPQRPAPVVDLDQYRLRRRGAQIVIGQRRRVNPTDRPIYRVVVPDWDAEGALDREVLKGKKPPPFRVKKIRRSGRAVTARRPILPRAERRLAWKAERRQTGTGWRESTAIGFVLAPVIPLKSTSAPKRNLCNHLTGTELDHWRRDSLRHLVSDIEEVLAKLPRQPIQLADHHKSLAAWLEEADVLTHDKRAA